MKKYRVMVEWRRQGSYVIEAVDEYDAKQRAIEEDTLPSNDAYVEDSLEVVDCEEIEDD